MARFAARIALSLAMLTALISLAFAVADGPDYFMVRGVEADDVLNIRAEPNGRSQKIGEIPPDGNGIQNLGCEGGLSIDEWYEASEAEREAAAKKRWCRIAYDGVEGWVAARFLTEGSEVVANPAEPTRWTVLAVNEKAPAAEAFVTFAPDGSVYGSTGCNRFSTRGIFNGNAVLINGPVMMTKMACPGDAVSEQEKTIMAGLQGQIKLLFDPFARQLVLSNPETGVTMRLVSQ
ncbi:MAG: META domain-containing protein [Pseudomonadota bacterium]